MRKVPNPAVIVWLDGQPCDRVWLTAITIMELHKGILLLAPGRRQSALRDALDRLTAEKIGDRIASFDDEAARAAAAIAAERRRRGRSGELRGTMIAGIALATGASLATRNTSHFDDLRMELFDPWTAY